MIERRSFLIAAALAPASLAMPHLVRAAAPRSQDVRLIDEVLRQLHPGLHRYLSPASYAAGIARLDRDWAAKPELETRFLALARFLSSIRCGHSQPNPYNQSKAVSARLFDRPADRLPFGFRWIGGKMVVLADHGRCGLKPGALIEAVNGIPTQRILRELLPYVRADGSNDGKRRALLSPGGTDSIETFDFLYALHFGAPAGGQFIIDWRAPDGGTRQRLSVKPITLAQRKAFLRKADTRSEAAPWQFAIDPQGIATMTMDSWAMYNSNWDWQGWIDARMGDAKGARGLIVDLRANEGGNDCGNSILARLAAQDIPLPKVNRLVRYRQVPAELNRYLDTWDDSFRDWGDAVQPFGQGFLRQSQTKTQSVITPKGPRIPVPLTVLIGPQNSSATFQFADLVKASGLGTLVGGTTGGNRRGINGGAYFFVRLPDSGLEFDLPLIGYYPELRQPDAGIEPDFRVENSAADIAAGRDRVMEAAKRRLLA